jgi:hypothetical protein
MASPVPYKISVPQGKIDVLKRKLSQATFPDELEASAWDLGSPLADMRRLTKAWGQWDWRQAETKLNQLPQFTTDVEVSGFGKVNVHFIHQRSDVIGAIPLLFVHGCKNRPPFAMFPKNPPKKSPLKRENPQKSSLQNYSPLTDHSLQGLGLS